MRRLPLIATLVVLLAVGTMIRLGVWQLDRLHEKQAMLARYAVAEADPAVRAWPGAGISGYARVRAQCRSAGATRPEAGRSATGKTGWAQVADCTTPGGARARLVLGWSTAPVPVQWAGGPVTGIYVPRGDLAVIFADPPLAGLQASARPDPRDLPNNHLAYAVQWFLFAAVALVIYALALRARMRRILGG